MSCPLLKYKSIPILPPKQINLLKIPVTRLGVDSEGVELFNEIYQWMLEEKEKNEWYELERTPSGGISKKFKRLPAYSLVVGTKNIELVLLHKSGQYRFLFGNPRIKEMTCTGRQAYNNFIEILKKFNPNTNIADLAISSNEEAQAVKESIPSPKIRVARELYKNKIFTAKDGIHHADLNSSFFSGIFEKYQKELGDTIRYIYDNRKTDPTNKDILTHTYGYFQSQWCNFAKCGKASKFALANLSKCALEFNNNMIDKLAFIFEKYYGATILAYNTDGVWYLRKDGPIEVPDLFGKGLGQYKNDYVWCEKIRFKSDGVYEFITSDGTYHPVVRGLTSLDKIRDREDWQWGDIYKGQMETYKFDKEKGVIYCNEEEEIFN